MCDNNGHTNKQTKDCVQCYKKIHHFQPWSHSMRFNVKESLVFLMHGEPFVCVQTADSSQFSAHQMLMNTELVIISILWKNFHSNTTHIRSLLRPFLLSFYFSQKLRIPFYGHAVHPALLRWCNLYLNIKILRFYYWFIIFLALQLENGMPNERIDKWHLHVVLWLIFFFFDFLPWIMTANQDNRLWMDVLLANEKFRFL